MLFWVQIQLLVQSDLFALMRQSTGLNLTTLINVHFEITGNQASNESCKKQAFNLSAGMQTVESPTARLHIITEIMIKTSKSSCVDIWTSRFRYSPGSLSGPFPLPPQWWTWDCVDVHNRSTLFLVLNMCNPGSIFPHKFRKEKKKLWLRACEKINE